MNARSARTGASYVVLPLVWCPACGIQVAFGHVCDPAGTDQLLTDLRGEHDADPR